LWQAQAAQLRQPVLRQPVLRLLAQARPVQLAQVLQLAVQVLRQAAFWPVLALALAQLLRWFRPRPFWPLQWVAATAPPPPQAPTKPF
jgi:hypothetical protein